MSEDEKRGPVYARLRSVRPAAVMAVVDGEARELAVRGGRAKWEKILTTAAELDAEALELFDDSGALLEVVRLREPAPAMQHSDDPEVSQIATLVAIALDAADRSVERQEKHVTQVLDAAISVMKVSAERTAVLERILMQVARMHEARLAEEPGAGDGFSQTDMLALIAAATIGGDGLPPGLMDRFLPSKPGGGATNGKPEE